MRWQIVSNAGCHAGKTSAGSPGDTSSHSETALARATRSAARQARWHAQAAREALQHHRHHAGHGVGVADQRSHLQNRHAALRRRQGYRATAS